jgi:hypothetical protein
MPLKDTIPNKALQGDEVLECAVSDFRAMLMRDCAFLRTISYRKVAYTLSATFHFGPPHEDPHVVKSRVKPQKDGVVEGEAPLRGYCDECGHSREQHTQPGYGAGACTVCICQQYDEEETSVVALERDVTLDNPNLARVHHDLPIRTQETLPPQPLSVGELVPGEERPTNPFPEVHTREIRYDKTQYPEGTPPVDRDVSDRETARLKRGGMGLRKR